ncbi:acyl transferase domain-containing protein [Streptomyces sp. 2333.5]|uniref:type I polyketide synthase n=1 Tax=unclassified Streptomyces TaxID=2593676 RepID=UPI0008957A18|nr:MULTISPECIES: type I polyketide synthase [unclassified Streptomyces]PJI99808.1 acyl transferase domain-containing protein [Streptomyces sp. 2333.5]SEB60082.1 Acyl transferase domain-containing protein [Streptomyces sp. 2314.4]SEC42210.1 candicidin polyketide synthase FscD [Streptomyces sp. 2112.2]
MTTDDSQLVAYLRKVTTDLQKTRLRLRDAETKNHEPIAIVGIGCRYPDGVHGADDLWRLVTEGRDAISGFPQDRGWDVAGLYDPDPDAVGKSYTREGGFLTDIDLFDADFFGLSPREALAMDPQQRLLLETSWEALESAGIRPATLRGSRTGVFTGVMHHDYGSRFTKAPDGFEGYVHMGSAGSMAVGRVAYHFGLEGPAVTVDTACSSSLVSLHLACQSLRAGECDLALAGGVAIMSGPTFFVEYSRQRVLSTDGRCHSFADDGDGTGWSEGVGVLAVERLSDARRLGHEVLAVVRGSAVNQDGASNGMTAPSGPAQQRVIDAALRNARLSADEIDVVEAHGTGTRLGDPIEAQALMATYGRGRSAQRPLWLGSLKSNIGHTQAAAGVGGVIKMVQALRHGVLPRSLYAERPSTEVDWSAGTVALLARERAWERVEDRPRRAGVSSFGMSGTNAHLIVEEFVPEPAGENEAEPPAPWAETSVPLVLSGRTPGAVRAQAAALREHLAARPELSLARAAREAAVHRTAFEHRASVTGDRDAVLAGLGSVTPVAAGGGRVAAVFSGQGAQHVGMGRQLAAEFPVFAGALDEVCAVVDPLLGRSLREVMWSESAEQLERTEFAQPALFAFEVALARLWQSWGVEFSVLAGHSVGEIAAAVVSGALSLDDAARLAVVRGRLMQRLPEGGAMLAVAAGEEEVAATLGDPALVGIAAVNGPEAVVVSGAREEVERVAGTWRERGRRTSRLRVSHAFHSPLMEPVLDELRVVADELDRSEPTLPVMASAETTHPFATAAYWVDHARRAVRFHDAAARLAEADVVVEIGPDAVLAPLIDTGRPVLPSCRREQSESLTLLTALGEAHAHGVEVDWTALFPAAARADLPPYPFQHRRYWLAPPALTGAGADALDHPLLSGVVELPGQGGVVLSGRIAPDRDPWLADHAVSGAVLFPGTGFLELALRAARQVGSRQVADLVAQTPLVLPAADTDIQVWVEPPGEPERALVIRGRSGDGDWVEYATGRLVEEPSEPSPQGNPPPDAEWATGQWPPQGAEEMPVEELYDTLAARGYGYGPVFRGLRALWRSGDELYAEVVLPERAHDGRYGCHPALLDAALHPLAAAAGSGQQVRLPFAFGRATVHSPGARELRVRLRTGSETIRLDAATSTGDPVLTVGELVLRAADTARLTAQADEQLHRLGYEVTWQLLPDPPRADRLPGTWIVLAPPATDVSWTRDLAEHTLAVDLDATLDRPALAARLTDATHTATDPDGVLLFAAHPDTLVTALQALTDAGVDAPVWCLTHESDDALDTAAVWGAGRAAALELPDRWGGLVDLPPVGVRPHLDRLAGLLRADTGEDQIRLRADGVSVRRLIKPDRPTQPPADWTPSGTVVITGGTGALGGHVARWVAGLGGCSLLLVSRRGPKAPGAQELLAELAATGTPVRIVAADVADRSAMAELVREAADTGTPVRAVFHAAGVADETPLLETTPDRFHAVLEGKAGGARVLDEVLGEADLDAFVVFSSVSGIWGGAGQSAYGAGNAVLDALAARRRARGLAGTALAWGPWSGGGMVDADLERRLRRQGLTPLPVNDAVAALSTAVSLGANRVLADVAWPRFLPVFTATRPAPLFTALRPTPRTTASAATAAPGPTAERLATLPAADRGKALSDLVRAEIASAVGHHDMSAVDAERPLGEFGFDSLMSVQLRNRLSAVTGVRLPATLVFDHPTAGALARHLESELATEPSPRPRQPATPRTAVADEPIAIVGMACRYPGAVASPEDLWQLVAQGRDAVTDFPTDRGWDLSGLYHPERSRAGTTYTRQGGFLDDPAGFDAEFFGISPREALAMDPQQRLLLEASWAAVEHAGIAPGTLRDSRTGVFVGTMYNDYLSRLSSTPESLEGIIGIANSNSVMSGRISYLLGLQGPAVTLDTACSSSLVALHLACQALRRGECDLALAGGATVMASPHIFVEFSRQGGLAVDGRCKSFSADADGTGWSEGVGLLAVERLSDARRLGHEVLAVVHGSAVNQDGASNGLTAPSGPAQQRVVAAALAQAGIAATEVDAVEAHGTGTRLGDPIEAQALIATYGREREPERPLYLGSLKSNIGHAQAAAGVGGVIKMVQALRHELLPRTLHADTPSPEVDWSSQAVRLLTEERPWPRGDRPRLAGVSSFGISGTNAHIVLAEGDPLDAEPAAEAPVHGTSAGSGTPMDTSDSPTARTPLPYVLTARSAAGLPAQARALHSHLLDHPGLEPADVARSLVTTRSLHAHRAVLVAEGRQELIDALATLADPAATTPSRAVSIGTAGPGRVAGLFSGQGAQRPGMGRELAGRFPVFAAVLDEVCAVVDPLLGRSLREVMWSEPAEVLERTEFAQPALFAFEVAMARLWQSWGVEFSVLAGHSVGEIAAACVSGVLSLSDAARMAVARGRLMQALPEGGAMVAIAASEDEVAASLADVPDVAIAAVNGPEAVVVSGTEADVLRIADQWREQGRRTTRLRVSHAFHSPLMDPMLDDFAALLDELTFHEPTLPISPSADSSHPFASAGYWLDHARHTVRFADALGALDGADVLVELGPDAALAPLAGTDKPVLPSARRDHPEVRTVVTTLASAHAHGVSVDWTAALGAGRQVRLPTYAFQHERYWLDEGPAAGRGSGSVGDPTQARFWQVVENQDLDGLTRTLGLDAETSLRAALPVLHDWHRTSTTLARAAGWRYRVAWDRLPTDDTAVALDGTWWIVVPRDAADTTTAEAVRRALAAAGANPRVLPIDPHRADRATLAKELAAAADGTVAGMVSLLAESGGEHTRHRGVAAGALATLVLLQALHDADISTRLWTLTRGAVRTGPADTAPDPWHAQVWGLGRVAALEHPALWGGLIDLPAEGEPAGLAAVLSGTAGEDQVALRGDGVRARRLTPADTHDAPGADAHTSGAYRWTDGAVLITGGTGALGAHTARMLASRGASRLVLVSRRGPAAPGAEALRAELEALGATVDLTACDVTDRDAVGRLAEGLAAEGTPVRAVVHAAGVAAEQPLTELVGDDFSAVTDAKVTAAEILDGVLGDDLAAFVVYSSIAGTWGSAGNGPYAAANAHLDALVERRRARGAAGTAVAWGPWSGGGMAGDRFQEEMLRRGVSALSPEGATAALAQALEHDDTTVTVADIDWDRFARVFASNRPSPLLRHLTEPAAAADEAAARTELAERLAALDVEARRGAVLDLVRAEVAGVLGHARSQAVAVDRAFTDMGFDSLMAVELRTRLGVVSGLALPTTLVFDHPSPAEVADFLCARFEPDRDALTHEILEKLDWLENTLLDAAHSQGARARFGSRLDALLARLDRTTAPPESRLSDPATDAIESATAEELLAFVEEHFD